MDLREYRESVSGPGNRHPWELVRPGIVRRLLSARLAGRAPELVLDVGCGDAFLVHELARCYPAAQFVAVDVNFDDDLLASLQAKLAGERIVLCRTLDEAAAHTRSPADVLLLLDVLEHIEDDVRFLEDLRGTPLVGDRTLVVVTVPAYERLFCSHDVFLGHYRRYNRRMLADRLSRAGYVTEESGELFASGLVFRALETARERWGRGRSRKVSGVAEWRGGRLATALVRSVLLLDFVGARLLRRVGIRLRGLSQYALCRPLPRRSLP